MSVFAGEVVSGAGVRSGGGTFTLGGWIGLGLRAESQTPQVSRVLPDSPAARAGIRANDHLMKIGSRVVNDYADASNAFFYLVPGQPVTVKLSRGQEQLEFTLTPGPPQE